MAAHGSGAIALSRGHSATLLNVDIGGGTTKFALIENGRILATCAIAVGGRLFVEDGESGLTRIEPPAQDVAKSLGIELALGKPLALDDRKRIATRMESTSERRSSSPSFSIGPDQRRCSGA